MSSRRIQAMARLIEGMDGEINAWYCDPMKSPDEVIRSLAVKLAGYRKEFKSNSGILKDSKSKP